MTQPAEPGQFLDTDNPLLAQAPARLETGSVVTPAGTLGVFTIRTATTTLTVLLSPADARHWARITASLADNIGGKLVPASAMDVAALSKTILPNGKRSLY